MTEQTIYFQSVIVSLLYRDRLSIEKFIESRKYSKLKSRNKAFCYIYKYKVDKILKNKLENREVILI